jgi:thiol-disulfide isomerase/thioredoxin
MKYFALVSLLFVLVFSAFVAVNKDRVITYDDKHNKIIKGIISFEELQRDTAFTWFIQEFTAYHPKGLAISQLKAAGREDQIVIFAGTWCGDTKEQLPRFYKVLQDANFPMHHVIIYGVDRKKHTIGREEKKYNIERIPTFIILRNGKEIGRIVETPVKSLEEDWVQYDETFERNQY